MQAKLLDAHVCGYFCNPVRVRIPYSNTQIKPNWSFHWSIHCMYQSMMILIYSGKIFGYYTGTKSGLQGNVTISIHWKGCLIPSKTIVVLWPNRSIFLLFDHETFIKRRLAYVNQSNMKVLILESVELVSPVGQGYWYSGLYWFITGWDLLRFLVCFGKSRQISFHLRWHLVRLVEQLPVLTRQLS